MRGKDARKKKRLKASDLIDVNVVEKKGNVNTGDLENDGYYENIEGTESAENKATDKDSPIGDEYLEKKCKIIGENIRRKRKKRNLSIENLAEYTELSSSYIGLLERGQRCPSLKSFLKICDIFGITTDELLSVEKGKKSKISVSEENKSSYQNKLTTIDFLVKKLDNDELEVVIAVLDKLVELKKNKE